MLGIIGGSDFERIPGVKQLESRELSTPFGEPSGPYLLLQIDDLRAWFLARHGPEHRIPPHRLPHKANIWGFRELGVKRILSVSSVGSLVPSITPGDVVIPDQIMHWNSPVPTYYNGEPVEVSGDDEPARWLREGRVVHVDFTEPLCPEMRDAIRRVMRGMELWYHWGGTYVQTPGPRFESAAEVRAIGDVGGTVVGMTCASEATLARELGLCYAVISVVSNMGAGIAGKITHDTRSTAARVAPLIPRVALALSRELPPERGCDCGKLEGTVF